MNPWECAVTKPAVEIERSPLRDELAPYYCDSDGDDGESRRPTDSSGYRAARFDEEGRRRPNGENYRGRRRKRGRSTELITRSIDSALRFESGSSGPSIRGRYLSWIPASGSKTE